MFSVQIPAKMLLPGSSHGWYHRNSVMRKREVTSKLHMSRRSRVRSDFLWRYCAVKIDMGQEVSSGCRMSLSFWLGCDIGSYFYDLLAEQAINCCLLCIRFPMQRRRNRILCRRQSPKARKSIRNWPQFTSGLFPMCRFVITTAVIFLFCIFGQCATN